MPIGSNSLALYYNKKMLTDAGVTSPPKTWAELNETATKTTKSPVYGIAFPAENDGSGHLAMGAVPLEQWREFDRSWFGEGDRSSPTLG